MRKCEESEIKLRLWMVKIEASERSDERSIERRDSISRKNSLKYIGSNFEGLSLKNIEPLQEIILPIQEIFKNIVGYNSYLGMK